MRYLFWFGSIVLASLILPYTLYAAPCEFPAFHIFPQIKFYENKEDIYLYPQVIDNLNMFKSEEVYKFTKEKSLSIIDKKEMREERMKGKQLTPNYLKVGDAFKIGDAEYTLLEFGIKKTNGEKAEALKINGISQKRIKEMLGDYPFEYLKLNLENPEIIESEIHIAIILGNKLFAGFGGGFAEGIGIPGGVAVFDFSRNQWNVDWRKELIDLYITDIIPISANTVWFSTKDESEFFTFPSTIFEYDIEKNTLKPLSFSDIDAWEVKHWGDFVFIVGPDGLTIYDLIKKQSQNYVWDLDINKKDIIIARLIKCDKKQCLSKERNKRIRILYIGSLFEVKNYRDFLKLTNQFLNYEVSEKDLERIFWLLEPYVDCGLWVDMPQDFIKYINVEELLLHSKTRKSPLVWRTLTRLIQLNKQEKLYKQTILEASKDPDEWVRRLAFEAMNYLGLERE